VRLPAWAWGYLDQWSHRLHVPRLVLGWVCHRFEVASGLYDEDECPVPVYGQGARVRLRQRPGSGAVIDVRWRDGWQYRARWEWTPGDDRWHDENDLEEVGDGP
jgi:hypothetical protein